jgi:hypothetical protein
MYLDINAVRSEALFASAVQRMDNPGAGQIRQAVAQAVREFGSRGCAARVAQEFGDHPETAVARMRWARTVIEETFGAARARAVASRPHARSDLGYAARAC